MVSLRLAEGMLSMCVPTTMTGELGARPYMVWKLERGGGEEEQGEGGKDRRGRRGARRERGRREVERKGRGGKSRREEERGRRRKGRRGGRWEEREE